MITTKQLLTAARRRFGKTAFVRENDAMTPQEREMVEAEVQEINDLISGTRTRETLELLVKAVELFLAVRDDKLAGEQLHEQVEKSRRHLDTTADRNVLLFKQQQLRFRLTARRWVVGRKLNFSGQVFEDQWESADTPEELMATIEIKKTGIMDTVRQLFEGKST